MVRTKAEFIKCKITFYLCNDFVEVVQDFALKCSLFTRRTIRGLAELKNMLNSDSLMPQKSFL